MEMLIGVFLTELAPGLALIGRRSRPWMISGAALFLGGAKILLPIVWRASVGDNPASIFWILVTFSAVPAVPYAFILLYGTKLIPRKTPSEAAAAS
jgi:hypothetical protein